MVLSFPKETSRVKENISFLKPIRRYNAPMETLGQRVRRARQASGMNASDFAKAIGLSKGSMSKLENGSILSIKMGTALKIEDLTGYRAYWVASGEGLEKGGDPEIEKLAQSIEALPPEHRAKIEAEIDFLLSLSDKAP